MEEYTRNSLRELRKAETELRRKKRKQNGSIFITILIILLFLGAGIFYVITTKPKWLGLDQSIDGWKDTLVSAFEPQERIEVRKTVDSALSKNQ